MGKIQSQYETPTLQTRCIGCMLARRRARIEDDGPTLNLCLLITTILVFNLSLGMKCVSKHQDLQIFVLKLNKYE